ncbi:MAG: NlpC/P60 family protein [Acidimicrobiales bacterium]
MTTTPAVTSNPALTVGAIQQFASQLSSIGGQLSAAASTGDFASVLSQVNSEITSIQDGGSLSSSSNASAGLSAAAGLSASGSSSGAPSSGSLGLLPSLVGGTSTGAPTAASSQGQLSGSAVVADAAKYLGVPYQWGGTSPSTGFDCSGLVQRVFADLGVSLPRTSQEQATAGVAVPSLAQAQPGDLVFFAGSDGTATSPGHVGIYIGNGQMIDAPQTGSTVQVQAVGQPVAIRRIVQATQGGSISPTSAGSVLAASNASATNAAMDALGVPSSYQPLFESAGQTYGVSPVLLAAVAKQESGFNPSAQSGAGALGLMQLMPATAAGLGVAPLDPASAIDGAAQLLSSYLTNYGGSVPLALAAYNAGPAAVASYGGVPPYAETQNYVSSITSMLSNAGVLA